MSTKEEKRFVTASLPMRLCARNQLHPAPAVAGRPNSKGTSGIQTAGSSIQTAACSCFVQNGTGDFKPKHHKTSHVSERSHALQSACNQTPKNLSWLETCTCKHTTQSLGAQTKRASVRAQRRHDVTSRASSCLLNIVRSRNHFQLCGCSRQCRHGTEPDIPLRTSVCRLDCCRNPAGLRPGVGLRRLLGAEHISERPALRGDRRDLAHRVIAAPAVCGYHELECQRLRQSARLRGPLAMQCLAKPACQIVCMVNSFVACNALR